jgi:hypothetical protein
LQQPQGLLHAGSQHHLLAHPYFHTSFHEKFLASLESKRGGCAGHTGLRTPHPHSTASTVPLLRCRLKMKKLPPSEKITGPVLVTYVRVMADFLHHVHELRDARW